MAGLRVHFVFPAGLVERVDAALTVGQSRGEFVRAAVEQALASEGRGSEDPGVSSSSLPAPAEQPEPRSFNGEDVRLSTGGSGFDSPSRRSVPARSSVQAKRDVRPVPKAKP